MKLYIKQKVFSWGEKFNVRDEYGEDRYLVEGEVFSLGHKLHVRDVAGNEVAYIAQKLLSWLPNYQVSIHDSPAAVVQQKFSWFRQKFEISGPACSGWTVQGSFWEHEYEVCNERGDCVVRISRALISWGDSYELEIADPADELLALAIVLTIDCVRASQNS